MAKRQSKADRSIGPQPTNAYLAADGVTAIAHGDEVYPVEGGRVDLPGGVRWVQELVDAGAITHAEARQPDARRTSPEEAQAEVDEDAAPAPEAGE